MLPGNIKYSPPSLLPFQNKWAKWMNEWRSPAPDTESQCTEVCPACSLFVILIHQKRLGRNSPENFVAPGWVTCSVVLSPILQVQYSCYYCHYFMSTWNNFTPLQIKSCHVFLCFQAEDTNRRMTSSFNSFTAHLRLMCFSDQCWHFLLERNSYMELHISTEQLFLSQEMIVTWKKYINIV